MSRWTLALLLAALAGVLPVWGQAARGKRYALLVGINTYEHHNLPALKYAERDVEALAGVLEKAGYEVTLLTGAAGRKKAGRLPNRKNVEARLGEVLRKCRAGDTVVLAFAGHGLQFRGKKDAFFCPVDARPFTDETATLVSLTKVYAELERSFAGARLLLVDACRTDPPDPGRGARGVSGDTTPSPPRGVAALFSCSSGQRAFETDRLQHGVFFHYVLQGLRGKAGNARGVVTWASLAEYVTEQVSDEVPRLIRGGATQTPHLMANLKGKSPVLLLLGGRALALKRGRGHLERKEYARAIVALTEAIKLKRSATAYRLRGNAYAGQGDHERAIADYDQAIRLDPRSAVAYYDRGLARTEQENYAEAISDFNEAIRLDGADAAAYHGRGLARAHQGEYDRAIADCTEAIRLDPDYAAAYRSRALAYRLRAWLNRSKEDEERAAEDLALCRRLTRKR
jgi:tetratricopeptide (TPR) repeat protein